MTSSSTPEAPHFRGKTLTPESPVPVHVPEPQNIPVLMNQTDLAFNDMSTHMEQRYPPQHQNVMESGSPRQQLPVTFAQATATDASQPGELIGSTLGGYENSTNVEGVLENALAYDGGDTDTLQESNSSEARLNAQPSVPSGDYDSFSNHANASFIALNPSQDQQSQDDSAQAVGRSSANPESTPVNPGSDAAAWELQPSQDSDAQSLASDSDANDEGVNYQALLDNLSPSVTTAPTSDNFTSTAAVVPAAPSSPGSLQTPIATLPIPAGLPPRPPPQEKPAIHPNYTPGEDIRSYHNPPAQNSTASNNAPRPPQGYNSSNAVGPNGMPPPPVATFQQPVSNANQTQDSPLEVQNRQRNNQGRDGGRPSVSSEGEDEVPRRPEVEKMYEEFLHDEAVYVAEGTWDRFPQGSRLFVGNLFTEKVTKRDIFYVFYKYGRLAQISMKSAYGFVQYHDTNSCMRALQSEQGIELRGRKIHLEISKPQKNTRNAAATAAGDSLRAGYNRRSRSPDYTRGGAGWQASQRSGGDRYDRNAGPIPFERRGRDDYRPGMRSPSPRGFRGRDDYRPGGRRSPDRYYRGRSRSPPDRNASYRNRSPRGFDPDDEASLPILRRNPRDVPDVQIILVDEVDRTFVGYIQQSFRDRRLVCDVMQLPRVSLAAVVRRQVVEGVQAVVKIFRKSQLTGKIPLQVYKRNSGVNNIGFDDYEDLDAHVAAELVVRAKTTHMQPAPAPAPAPQQYPQAPAYGAPQYPQPHHQMHPPQQQPQPQPQPQPQQQQQQPLPQTGGNPPNLANLITSLDGPALQKLLGAMSQTPQTPSNPHQSPPSNQPGQQPDLSSLLQSVSRHQPNQPPHQQPAYQAPQQQGYGFGNGPPQQQNAYGAPAPNPQYGNNPGFSPHTPQTPQAGNFGRPPNQGYPPQQQQQQPAQQHNVQDMLAQLARYK